MGLLKQRRYLLDLPVAVVAAEVDGGTHGHGAHVPGLVYRSKQDLFVAIRGAEQLVVVELHQKGDAMGPTARHAAKHAQGGRHGTAACFRCQFHNRLGIEILGVRRKGSPSGVFYPLVYRQNREVARAAQSSMAVELLQAAQHLGVAVAQGEVLHRLRTWKVQPAGSHLGWRIQKQLGFCTQQARDRAGHGTPSKNGCSQPMQACRPWLLRKAQGGLSGMGGGGPTRCWLLGAES